jgi:FHA domain
VVIAALGVVSVAGLRALGVTRDHPWIQQLRGRPGHDGQDVMYPGPQQWQPVDEYQWQPPEEHQWQPAAEQQWQPVDEEPPHGVAYEEPAYQGFMGHDGGTRAASERAVVTGMPTVMEQAFNPTPLLRLHTGDSTTETRMSGARAGRGAVELALPEVPTVSREHARFTFSDGQWRIANLGMNGLTVNGSTVAGEHPLCNGDSIRWGTRPDALLSRVEIM